MKKLGLIFCFLFHLYQCISDIYLDTNNNKFDKMLIFINDNVEEGDGTFITRIKEYMNNASKSLLKATSNMDPKKAGVQFGTVYIRVPTTWAVNGVQIVWQHYNKADFFITMDIAGSKNLPYTKQLGKCGEPGQFTRFPKSFFKSVIEKDVFQSGKKIMNEFVKLRYGVFSEEPTRNQLTTFDGQNFINSVCGKEIQWKINKEDKMHCKEPNRECKYIILPNQSHNYSVMFDTVTPSSELFCDDKERPHNKYAKNLQNRKCHKQSITKIILKHQDFRSDKISRAYEEINFVVVKGENRRIISKKAEVSANGNDFETNLTYIHRSFGPQITLLYTIPISKRHYTITLIDPQNITFTAVNRIEIISGITLTFVLARVPISGMYRIRFSRTRLRHYKRQAESFEVSFTISATPPITSNRIINPTGELSDSEIDMLSDVSTIQATVDLTTCGILKEENITVTLVMDAPRQNNMVKSMTDDGMGDDSIEDDKIFSKSLIAKDLEEVGFYTFRANVEIFNQITKDLIKRTVELGSLRVKAKQSKPIEDKIPPSKIENVKLDIIDSRKKILKVEIQATGNDGMIGNISKYEFMINSSTNIVETKYRNTAPKEILKFQLELQNYNITNPFEVSARGIDDNNNPGEWSSAQIYNWKYIELEKAEIKQRKCSGRILISFFTMMFCLIHLYN